MIRGHIVFVLFPPFLQCVISFLVHVKHLQSKNVTICENKGDKIVLALLASV